MMTFRSIAVRHASPEDVDYVVRRMRQMDRKEIFSLRHSRDDESLIAEMVGVDVAGACPFHYAVARAHVFRPVALMQLVMMTPVAGAVNLFATDEWRVIARDFTRFVREVFVPDCIKAGLTRVEVRALASWRENCRWLESLGAVRECEVKGFGPSPYVQFAWTLPDEKGD